MLSLEWIVNSATGPIDGSRVAIVIAHPDDEAIGCGALMSRLRNVKVIAATDGAPADGLSAKRQGFSNPREYAEQRAIELRASLAIPGVPESNLIELGVPDGAVWHSAAAIILKLAQLFDETDIDTVITHSFEGGHSDHDGLAYCVHLAAGMFLDRAPIVYETPYYHVGANGFTVQTFCDGDPGACADITNAQKRMKAAMFSAHATQSMVLSRFDPGVERYRIAPRYDFRRPPNQGNMRYASQAPRLGLPHWMLPEAPLERVA
jgi:LmbE family N-acetylglucosaminyl deacetylase